MTESGRKTDGENAVCAIRQCEAFRYQDTLQMGLWKGLRMGCIETGKQPADGPPKK
jgi:hypothetical protein